MSPLILIIEDEVRSAGLLKTYLEMAGFRAETAFDGLSGLEAARSIRPDLILLDLMLPLIDGNEICRTIREESDVPVIMLTAKGGKDDRISGFSDGADDYIVKPYDPDEVIARIKAVLKRSGSASAELQCGPLRLNPGTESVSVHGIPLPLTHAQFSVMSVFMHNPDTVLSRRRIIELAFSDDFDAYERAVDSHIRRLRKLIHSDDFQPIRTIYGGGYRLVCTAR